MFIAIYQFKIYPGMEEAFVKAWKKRTEGIYLLSGSLGSRLHKDKSGDYIGYAQWPTKEQWQNTDRKVIDSGAYPEYQDAGKEMRKCIEKSETLFELEVEADYLHSLPFSFE
ncbi:antibiotic biosynthesis monooxygenase [Xenorhabdus sp. 12]|uniref:Antibiotic biosynthesis monooxygenase n=1 Tax=Xenorhabdus santafensis TaxID=2582833 RepID=A0ABU4S625_9GAMM|nr:antibiotic biosynthesis monooxygenase [Xenorhabdus sp. 12]MDX7986644.1 antibiotic biosynthesis monooxygenase [Xenorhabdus sp. 12]